MNENLPSILIASIPIVLYLIQQFYTRRKNRADYGDDLLEVTNKMAASLRDAHEELGALKLEMREADQEHTNEIATIEKTWRERQDRMRARVVELEKVIVKYDISFTLTTHPQVTVTDLKVVGKDDVTASQKMNAVK